MHLSLSSSSPEESPKATDSERKYVAGVAGGQAERRLREGEPQKQMKDPRVKQQARQYGGATTDQVQGDRGLVEDKSHRRRVCVPSFRRVLRGRPGTTLGCIQKSPCAQPTSTLVITRRHRQPEGRKASYSKLVRHGGEWKQAGSPQRRGGRALVRPLSGFVSKTRAS